MQVEENANCALEIYVPSCQWHTVIPSPTPRTYQRTHSYPGSSQWSCLSCMLLTGARQHPSMVHFHYLLQ